MRHFTHAHVWRDSSVGYILGELSPQLSMWTENFQMFKLDLEKKGTTGQIANIHWIIEKAREFQKIIYFCFIGYAKAFDCDCVDHDKFWKIL